MTPDPFSVLGSAPPPARFTVADVVRDCAELDLLDDLRKALHPHTAPQQTDTLRAVRDLVYELAGSPNRDLAVDVLIHATGLGEFERRTLRQYARRHGLTPEGFRKQVLAMKRRLGLSEAIPPNDAN